MIAVEHVLDLENAGNFDRHTSVLALSCNCWRLAYIVLSRHRPLRDYYSNNFAFEDGKNHHMVRYVLHRVSASPRSFSLWIGRTDPVGERTSVWPSSQSLWKWAQSAPLGVVFNAVKKTWFRDRFDAKCLWKNVGILQFI